MYLEPIFSSEDIMRQMPEESRKFKAVDKMWRGVMANTCEDTRVLVATGQPNMLDNLKQCNALLDEIQKGLNDYLEKKRLFFPRYALTTLLAIVVVYCLPNKNMFIAVKTPSHLQIFEITVQN